MSLPEMIRKKRHCTCDAIDFVCFLTEGILRCTELGILFDLADTGLCLTY